VITYVGRGRDKTDGAVSINGHFVAIIDVKGEIGSRGAGPMLRSFCIIRILTPRIFEV